MNENKRQILKSFLDDTVSELNAKLVTIEPLQREVDSKRAELEAAERRLDEASEGIEELLSDKAHLEVILGIKQPKEIEEEKDPVVEAE